MMRLKKIEVSRETSKCFFTKDQDSGKEHKHKKGKDLYETFEEAKKEIIKSFKVEIGELKQSIEGLEGSTEAEWGSWYEL